MRPALALLLVGLSGCAGGEDAGEREERPPSDYVVIGVSGHCFVPP